MNIRKTSIQDLKQILDLYVEKVKLLRKINSPISWNDFTYLEDATKHDISDGYSFVMEDEYIVASFALKPIDGDRNAFVRFVSLDECDLFIKALTFCLSKSKHLLVKLYKTDDKKIAYLLSHGFSICDENEFEVRLQN